MKVSLYNQKAEVIGDIELNSKIFEVKPEEHLMAESVYVQQSNSRKGTSHTKTRGDVSGGGKKPWKQKGTGRARAGSIRSPIWRGGGIVFGPTSARNWERKINKKAKSKALFMSLSDKVMHKQFAVIENLDFTAPKTKEFNAVLTSFKKAVDGFGKKVLLVLPKNSDKVVKSSRNLPNVTPVLASSLNIVDVLKADSLLVLKESLPVIETTFLTKKSS